MNVFVPTPDHDHVVDNSRVNSKPIWWEVRPVLILDASDWPAADGSTGITLFKEMDEAEAAGEQSKSVPTFSRFSVLNEFDKRHDSPVRALPSLDSWAQSARKPPGPGAF